jgi:ATP-dependent DNA helicase RecQ
LQQAIHYAERRICRSRLLLTYFDEAGAAACEICDVCTGRNAPELRADIQENYARKIKTLLQKEALSPQELIEAFSEKRKNTVIAVLQFMIDDGSVKYLPDEKLTCS